MERLAERLQPEFILSLGVPRVAAQGAGVTEVLLASRAPHVIRSSHRLARTTSTSGEPLDVTLDGHVRSLLLAAAVA